MEYKFEYRNDEGVRIDVIVTRRYFLNAEHWCSIHPEATSVRVTKVRDGAEIEYIGTFYRAEQ